MTHTEIVDALLARAHLSLTDDEHARLVRIYALVEADMAALRLPEARYAEPAVTSRPSASHPRGPE